MIQFLFRGTDYGTTVVMLAGSLIGRSNPQAYNWPLSAPHAAQRLSSA